MADNEKITKLKWSVHTPELIKEIIECSGIDIYRIPLSIFLNTLRQTAARAAEINDPKLNEMMCRLALYSVSDPHSEDYDAELTNRTIYWENQEEKS